MANLTFTTGNVCGGDTHFDITATLGSKSLTVRTGLEYITEPLDKDEGEQLIKLLTRLLVSQLSNKSGSNVRSKLNALTLSLKAD